MIGARIWRGKREEGGLDWIGLDWGLEYLYIQYIRAAARFSDCDSASVGRFVLCRVSGS
jgi:hypothetical protein